MIWRKTGKGAYTLSTVGKLYLSKVRNISSWQFSFSNPDFNKLFSFERPLEIGHFAFKWT